MNMDRLESQSLMIEDETQVISRVREDKNKANNSKEIASITKFNLI
ncbi:hypothetical protein ACHJH3_06870 [Campylobacter sp. MOP7]